MKTFKRKKKKKLGTVLKQNKRPFIIKQINDDFNYRECYKINEETK